MTSITARNSAALVAKHGTTLPETPAPTKRAKQTKAEAPAPDATETKAPAPARPATVACGCGCGTEAKPGRLYLPGHDARHAGQVGRALAAKAPGAEDAALALPPALQAKARAFATNRAKEATRKAEAARIREEAARQLKAALAAL